MTPQQLKNSILQRAIEGRLVPQKAEEGTAKELLQKIQAEKAQLIAEKKIKKTKALPPISDEEIPFDIPDSWEWVRLQDICFPLKYGTSNKSDKRGKIPVLRMGNIQNGEIDYSDLVYSSNKEDIDKYYLNVNDLLFNRTNSREWVGKTAIYRGDMPAIFAGYLIQIRTLLVDAVYLNYVMNSDYERNYCKRVKSDGINQSNVNGQKLAKFIVPLPPLAEQKRIGKKMEELLPLIDKYDKAYTKLTEFNARFPEDMKKSILQYAIEGKLVEQRKEEGTADVLLQQIQAEKKRLIEEKKLKKTKPLPPITEDEIPFDIPASWKWVHLVDIFDIARGGSPRPIKEFLTTDENGINWVKIGDTEIGGKYIKNTKEKIIAEGLRKSRLVKCGDLLLTNSMSYGRPYIMQTRGAIHDGWLVLSPYIDEIDKDFFYYLISSPYIQNEFANTVAGAVVKNLNKDKVKEIIVPLPPLAEQHRIVAKIEELLPLCEQLIK